MFITKCRYEATTETFDANKPFRSCGYTDARVLLVKNYVISCYYHLARGDYNSEAALIFELVVGLFLDVSEENLESGGFDILVPEPLAPRSRVGL